MPAFLLNVHVCAEYTLVSRGTVIPMIVWDLVLVSYTQISSLRFVMVHSVGTVR